MSEWWVGLADFAVVVIACTIDTFTERLDKGMDSEGRVRITEAALCRLTVLLQAPYTIMVL